jgi:hypothetical protein
MSQAAFETPTAWHPDARPGTGDLNATAERGSPCSFRGHMWRWIRPISQVPRQVPRQVPEGRVAHVPA